jgi:UDP-2-acetamido-2,6-beta-L-arabino-hexul-4-ose reductase
MKKIVVTGAGGLLGRHICIRLHARNCAKKHAGLEELFEIESLNHSDFENPLRLKDALSDSDYILHFAGVNRAPESEIEKLNPLIAEKLVSAYRESNSSAHVVYANSTHYINDTAYGRSKRLAHEIIQREIKKYTNLIIPHVFGEGARPNYNNVTATFIDQIIHRQEPHVNPEGRVELLHAGSVAEAAIDAVVNEITGDQRLNGKPMGVLDLVHNLAQIHRNYSSNVFPDLTTPFETELFNTYRYNLYPKEFPRQLRIHADQRGSLFEAVKGGSAGQTFLSWTQPGVTRGDHFHLRKVERFLVLRGCALIRIRPVLEDTIWEYEVKGENPSVIDMPTLHTHSIENVGNEPLLTLFWTNEIFNTNNPDTYADTVLKG